MTDCRRKQDRADSPDRNSDYSSASGGGGSSSSNNRISTTDSSLAAGPVTTDDATSAEPPTSSSSTAEFHFLLSVVDALVSGLLIGPMTVSFWRGGWSLLDRHLFPDDRAASGWICSAVANVGILTLVYVQFALTRRLRADNIVHWVVGYHLYSYVFGVLNIAHWRGVWVLLDYYTGTGALSAWISFIVGQTGLWLLRSSRNALAPPMIVLMDIRPDFFGYSTRFNTKPSNREHFMLDSVLTVFVIHQLIVVYWRGVWTIMDVHIFPDARPVSAAVSLAVAFLLQAALCLLQPSLNALYRRLSSTSDSDGENGAKRGSGRSAALRRWALEASFFFVANLVGVGHWRGFWMLLDLFFLPSRPDLSCAVTHAAGMVVLWTMACGHSVTQAGCCLEGESSPSNGCVVPNYYVRYLVAERRERVRQRPHVVLIASHKKNVTNKCKNGGVVSGDAEAHHCSLADCSDGIIKLSVV